MGLDDGTSVILISLPLKIKQEFVNIVYKQWIISISKSELIKFSFSYDASAGLTLFFRTVFA